MNRPELTSFLAVPFDESFDSHGLTPRQVLGLSDGRADPRVFNTDKFGFDPVTNSLFVIDPTKSSFTTKTTRNWAALLEADTLPSERKRALLKDYTKFKANFIAAMVTRVYLTEERIITEHPSSKLHNIRVVAGPESTFPMFGTGSITFIDDMTPDVCNRLSGLRQTHQIPAENKSCKADPKRDEEKDKYDLRMRKKKVFEETEPVTGTETEAIPMPFDVNDNLPDIADLDADTALSVAKDTRRKRELDNLNHAMEGNLVDSSKDMLYTDEHMAMIRKGNSHVLVAPDFAELQCGGGYGAKYAATTELNWGRMAVNKTPFEEVSWGPSNEAPNSLLHFLPVGNIVTPYPFFTMQLPKDIIQAVRTFKDLVG